MGDPKKFAVIADPETQEVIAEFDTLTEARDFCDSGHLGCMIRYPTGSHRYDD